MSSVTALRPKSVPPGRQRLADLHAQQAASGAEIATLRPSQAEREAAASALPGAEQALKNLLFENELNPVDKTALATARGRVLELRSALAGKPDVAARIASLHAESARIGAAIATETTAAIFAEVDRLCAAYQTASKAALTAEAALDGLGEYARNMQDPGAGGALLTACVAAKRMHGDAFESGQRSEALGKVLAAVRADWSRFPSALASDPEARPEPLEAAIRLIPVRSEEQGADDDRAA